MPTRLCSPKGLAAISSNVVITGLTQHILMIARLSAHVIQDAAVLLTIRLTVVVACASQRQPLLDIESLPRPSMPKAKDAKFAKVSSKIDGMVAACHALPITARIL